MQKTTNIEFENENRQINYPFSHDSLLEDSAGNKLPSDFIEDASLYPESGKCSLVRVHPGSELDTVNVSVSAASEEYFGTFSSESRTVELFSASGVHRGTLVLGNGKNEFIGDPSEHVYSDARFCDACQFELGPDGVSSVRVNEEKLTGDVEFESDSDIARIETVVTENPDGSMNLRFDALSSRGLYSAENSGIRSITILRNTGSNLNVISRAGNPYLFLSKNGRMTGGNLIGRSKICSSVDGRTAGKSYRDRTSSDDCGRDRKSDSEEHEYTYDECSIPKEKGESIWDYLVRVDPMTIVRSDTGRFYGECKIPEMNGFGATDSVATMFIEGTLTAKFSAIGGSILAILTVEHTLAASALFLGEYIKTPQGNVINRHRDIKYLYLKPEHMEDFFNHFHGSEPGSIGYQDADTVEALCVENGWLYSFDYPNIPDGMSVADFEHENSEKIRALGLDKCILIYTVRARDYFEHFNCRNWEISTADSLGDEVRHLVGWGTGSGFMLGGNSYSTFTNSDGESVTLPKWLAARYVWWKKYSKNGSQMRHFIVPKERGLVIYTGNYYKNDDETDLKETSRFSWICNNSWNYIMYLDRPEDGGDYFIHTRWEELLDTMRERLTKVYSEDYDPTHGDNVFYGLDEEAFEAGRYEIRTIEGISVDDMDAEVMKYNNRITSSSMTAQPYDAPVTGGVGSKGPFEYRYGRTFTTGYAQYPDEKTNEELDAEAIKAPEVYTFDIDTASSNAFNFDTTDMLASGMVYDNPIHIEASDNVAAPESLKIDDPVDTYEVAEEMKKLTTPRTSGNGITISIAGLEA